jgi:NAD(P)-dependent dehydrogenase (short-subunit alcohol dehydrogenase family)
MTFPIDRHVREDEHTQEGVCMNQLLEGRVAIVTGAASGNGRAIAIAFAEQGADVVLADIREDPREGGETTEARIRALSDAQVSFVRCDVTSTTDLEATVEAADAFGGVDILVNNAGILSKQSVLEASEAEFEQMMSVNVKSVYFGTQAAARSMVARGAGGSIINMSSIAGMRGTGGYAAYCTTKGAVRHMTYALADELGPNGIRVNALHPGIIETQMNIVDDPLIGTDQGEGYLQMIPLRRWGQPGDVADAAVYLASDLAAYVSGASLVVDGGYLRS